MYSLYKHLVIEDADEAPTEAEIHAIEVVLGASLPADFLDFLRVANGGSLEDYELTVPLDPQPERMGFSRIFTTKDGPVSFLVQLEWQRNPDDPLIPPKVLPFAEDGGGSTLFLDLRIDGESPVIAFMHGLPAWTGLHQRDELIKIADSFTQYLDLLEFDATYSHELLLAAIAEKNHEHIAANVEYLNLALPNWRRLFNIDDDQLTP